MALLPVEAFRSSDVAAFRVTKQDQTAHVLTTGALLKTSVMVAVERVTDGGVTYLTATNYDVGRGAPLRRGRISPTSAVRPDEPSRVLARYLINGEDLTCEPTRIPNWATASALEKKRVIAYCAGVAVAVDR